MIIALKWMRSLIYPTKSINIFLDLDYRMCSWICCSGFDIMEIMASLSMSTTLLAEFRTIEHQNSELLNISTVQALTEQSRQARTCSPIMSMWIQTKLRQKARAYKKIGKDVSKNDFTRYKRLPRKIMYCSSYKEVKYRQ